MDEVFSPSQFMRRLRPELYSDSTVRTRHKLKPEVLSHHLDTLTERNETHGFELFCRKLCERTICPNLRPATGPEGGGDSKADTETSPVSTEVSKLTYIGLANNDRERWAFAFSAKKTWAAKARADVAGIVGTNRGYTKIFFVTSRAARAKDRARVEDELTRDYGVQVVIHDRSWILDEIIEKGRVDLAYNYLGVGEQGDDLDLGPTDYSRKQQLADIEAELADSSAFAGMAIHRAAEALVAAKLSRNLELPRTDVEGRFMRAVRLAEDGGTQRQRLAARYESLWTAFWWFDDIKAVVNGYDAFEALVIGNEHAINLELLCNLSQLLFNVVTHGQLTAEEAGLQPRISRLSSRLAELAADDSRPNNALEAKTSLLAIQVNEALSTGDSQRLSALWPQFGNVIVKAEGLGEFDAERLTKMIGVFGQVAGKDRGYRDLVDQVSAFVARRTGEGEGALILQRRAEQLDLDEHLEIIRLLGKAARLLGKKEYAEEFVRAQAVLGLAYLSAGLLWAARASSTSAATTLFIEDQETGDISPTIFPILMNVAWQAVELKHFPEIFQILRIARGCLNRMPISDESRARAVAQLQDFDLVLACQIANLSAQDTSSLEKFPDVLRGLEMVHSRATLLYMLGYEDLLREQGWIPEIESSHDVATLFNRMAGQPAGDARWRPAIFNMRQGEEFVTSVLGVRVHVTHTSTDTCITVSEAIVGTVEAFFATALDLDAFAHVERFDVCVVEADVTRFEVAVDADEMTAIVKWPTAVFPGTPSVYSDFLSMLLEVATSIFAATCRAKDFEDAATRLFKSDAAMDRAAMIGSLCFSRERLFDGVARLDPWDKLSPKRFEAKADRPKIDRQVLQRTNSLPTGEDRERSDTPKMTDHRGLKVHSVIDVHLWDRAEWKGAAYGVLDTRAPPFMALIFRNEEAAAKIFERWRERFGDTDGSDEIHIGIVRRLSAVHPAHYGMLVTSKLPSSTSETRLAMLGSRSMTMEPQNEMNLTRFLDDYKRTGVFLLMPMVFGSSGEPKLLKDLYVLKRRLEVKMAAEVGQYDVESIFLKLRGYQFGPQ